MMNIPFRKMHGNGNDFVVIEAEDLPTNIPLPEFCAKIAHRQFGIGCDQVLIVDEAETADFKMRIFNNDGSEVEMCGNGIRCLARYVYETGMTDQTKMTVETLAGTIVPEIVGDMVKVDMGIPRLKSDAWVYPEEKTLLRPFTVGGETLAVSLVSMGNPHCVIVVPEITDRLVLEIGPQIERHPDFPKRINVEFIKVLNRGEIEMRVWERGSGETLACGTGATAAAVACHLNGLTDKSVTVKLKGGMLKLELADDGHMYMTGPATTVFEGEYFHG